MLVSGLLISDGQLHYAESLGEVWHERDDKKFPSIRDHEEEDTYGL